MNEKILNALKTKYANLGLSDQILTSIAEMVANSVSDESEIEGAISKYESLMKTMQSDLDKVRTKTKPPQDKPKGADNNPEPPEPKKDEPVMPEWARTLTESFTNLQNELQSIKGEKITSQRKTVFDEIIKDLPESLKAAYSRTDISKMSDDEFSSLTGDLKKEVENITKEIGIKGGIFKTPYGGKNQRREQGRSEDEIKKIVDKIKV